MIRQPKPGGKPSPPPASPFASSSANGLSHPCLESTHFFHLFLSPVHPHLSSSSNCQRICLKCRCDRSSVSRGAESSRQPFPQSKQSFATTDLYFLPTLSFLFPSFAPPHFAHFFCTLPFVLWLLNTMLPLLRYIGNILSPLSSYLMFSLWNVASVGSSMEVALTQLC